MAKYTTQKSGFSYWLVLEDGKVVATEPDESSADTTRNALDVAQQKQASE
jgi:hypothetical protein